MAYLRDISAILGVSVSTVSKALKGYPDISEETRRRVIRTAEEIGYEGGGDRDGRAHDWSRQKPDMADSGNCCRNSCGTDQKGVIGQYTGAIGVLAPDIEKLLESAFYRELLCSMAAEAVLHNRDLVILGTDMQKGGADIAAAEGLAGICLITVKEQLGADNFLPQADRGIPLVRIEIDAGDDQRAASSMGAADSLGAAGSLGVAGSPYEIGKAAVRRFLKEAEGTVR